MLALPYHQYAQGSVTALLHSSLGQGIYSGVQISYHSLYLGPDILHVIHILRADMDSRVLKIGMETNKTFIINGGKDR